MTLAPPISITSHIQTHTDCVYQLPGYGTINSVNANSGFQSPPVRPAFHSLSKLLGTGPSTHHGLSRSPGNGRQQPLRLSGDWRWVWRSGRSSESSRAGSEDCRDRGSQTGRNLCEYTTDIIITRTQHQSFNFT